MIAICKSRISDTNTKFGGAFPRDYLEADSRKVILWTGRALQQRLSAGDEDILTP